jgi:hypothetical protein
MKSSLGSTAVRSIDGSDQTDRGPPLLNYKPSISLAGGQTITADTNGTSAPICPRINRQNRNLLPLFLGPSIAFLSDVAPHLFGSRISVLRTTLLGHPGGGCRPAAVTLSKGG